MSRRTRDGVPKALRVVSDSSSTSSWVSESFDMPRKKARRSQISDDELARLAHAGDKKAARQLRNRESARRSRLTKDCELTELRSLNAELAGELEEQKSTVELQAAEIRKLQAEIAVLRGRAPESRPAVEVTVLSDEPATFVDALQMLMVMSRA